MKEDTLMTIPELMKFLQVKRNTIYTLRKMGLPTVKIGRSVRFRLDSIQSWLSRMEEKPLETPHAAYCGSFGDNTSHLL